jgi:hypothetical protein
MSSPSLRIRRHRVSGGGARRLWPVTMVVAATALALTGCGEPGVLAPIDSPEPSTSTSVEPSPAPGASETPDDSPAPSGSAQPTTPPVAGDLACTDVFTAAQLYDFNPNFAPTADAGDLPGVIADIADAGGTVCAYQHVTGADRLVIGVLEGMGNFSAPEFETVGDEGVATSTNGSAVVAAASIYFGELRDAQPVLDEVAENLE